MIDASTLRVVWEAHADRLLLIARAIGEPAEDAVQEAFVALATQQELPNDPLAWLVQVTRNQLLQWRRRHRRRRQREGVVGTKPWLRGDVRLIDQEIDGALVTKAIQNMPSPQREIIVMHLWGDMTFESIAEVVGGSRASAHRAFRRGLEQLKQQFNPELENRHNNASTNA